VTGVGGHVFLSYRHDGPDAGYVERLAEFLAGQGMVPWFDHRIVSGDRWHEVIREHVDTCVAFVVVMTPAAEGSPWVNREITQAEKMGRPVLPLLLGGDGFFRLGDLQYDDVRDGRMPPERFLARLRELVPDRPVALTGHSGPVTAVAWSPDGRWIATGSQDRTVRLWSAATGAEVRVLTGSGHAVLSVAWSPDGRLATAGADRNVRLWDPVTGAELRALTGHTDWVRSVSWSLDARELASAGSDATVRIWDPDSGELRETLVGHGSMVTAVAWTPEGRLASAGEDGTVRFWVWGQISGREVSSLPPRAYALWALDFSSVDDRLAYSGEDGTVSVVPWPGYGAAVDRLGHDGPVGSVAWAPTDGRLATASWDGTVRIWDEGPAPTSRVLAGPDGPVNGVAWSPDGRRLATAHADHTARLWSVLGGPLR
jgi:TIR domain/WD domain, G-beta repeat